MGLLLRYEHELNNKIKLTSMKVFFFGIIIMLSSIKVLSQDTLQYNFKMDDNGNVYFDETIEIEGKSKVDLFLKGKEWFSKDKRLKNRKKEKGLFMDAEKIDNGQFSIDFEDKDEGKIFGIGRTNILVYSNMGVKKNGGSFTYKITTLFKDGKTKIIIDELTFEKGDMMGVNSGALITEHYPKQFGSFGKSQIKKQWKLMREQAIKEFEEIISDYKQFMLKKDIKSSDW
jgi:Domain of unknown function (DUF4468) with TBP-like fold